jgi:hypothetical protein
MRKFYSYSADQAKDYELDLRAIHGIHVIPYADEPVYGRVTAVDLDTGRRFFYTSYATCPPRRPEEALYFDDANVVLIQKRGGYIPTYSIGNHGIDLHHLTLAQAERLDEVCNEVGLPTPPIIGFMPRERIIAASLTPAN